jgi:hypothetical protein
VEPMKEEENIFRIFSTGNKIVGGTLHQQATYATLIEFMEIQKQNTLHEGY